MKILKSIVLLVFFAVATAFTISSSEGYKIGDTVEDFSLKNIDNSMVSLADYKEAKGFIVVFTCNHCPYSKIYEERIIALDKKYKTKGYCRQLAQRQRQLS